MLQSLFVKGEVSNCKHHSSGHIYFTLKDQKGTISCVMFAGNRNGLEFRLTEGQQVVVSGSVDVYERDGKYQMYARKIVLDGMGQLHERFEKLKRDLEERGMFAAEYKKPIPRYIKSLGVVTAPTGAAVRDIIQIATRRNPYVQIILYPAIVQGEQAAESIVYGIRALEQQQVDLIIVGRGGGSIEDLWAFNEEIVAQAVFDCHIPVISAVGHETDTTIVDFVSDLRAPTPSAAAELAVYEYARLQSVIADCKENFGKRIQRKIQMERHKADSLGLRLKYVGPAGQLREKRTYMLKLEEKLQEGMRSRLFHTRHALELYIEKMKGLSPLNKLNQGFSYVSILNGKTVRKVGQVQVGDKIHIQVTDGSIYAEVTDKEDQDVHRGELC